jgi:hypothetical protein
MSKELIISPRSEHVREELAEAAAWSAYAAELREVLGAAMEKSGADLLEVGELLVSEPLLGERRGLRNGAEVRPAQAIGLAEGMAAGAAVLSARRARKTADRVGMGRSGTPLHHIGGGRRPGGTPW